MENQSAITTRSFSAPPTGPWIDRSRFDGNPGAFPLSVSMLSWALNEEENILDFLGRARDFLTRLGCDFEHILIDDGSSDSTFELATSFQAEYPQLKVYKNPRNLGSGWNTRLAVSYASKDILFWQMVDWSYDISRLPEYLWLLRKHDVIQGIRVKTSNTDRTPSSWNTLLWSHRSDNPWKSTISLVNYLLVRLLFRVPVLDYQNVTIYPTALAQSLELESHSAFTNPEMIIKAYWRGAEFRQVAIPFIARKKGVSKGTRLPVILRSFRQIIGFWLRWSRTPQPWKIKRGTIIPWDGGTR